MCGTLARVLAIAALLVTTRLNANSIYVDVANQSGIEDGTSMHPYRTLRAGVSHATPGDTVLVAHGIYNETGAPLSWPAGIAIVGAGVGSTNIHALLKVASEYQTRPVVLARCAVDSVEIGRTDTVRDAGASTLVRDCETRYLVVTWSGANDVTLERVTSPLLNMNGANQTPQLRQIRAYGCTLRSVIIVLSGPNDLVIDSTWVQGPATVTTAGDALLEDETCAVTRSKFDSTAQIAMTHMGLSVRGNQFLAELSVTMSNGATVIDSNELGRYGQAFMGVADDLTFSNNEVSTDQSAYALAFYGSRMTVTDNDIHGGSRAMYVVGEDLHVTNNVISGSGGDGINLNGSGEIASNQVSSCAAVGINATNATYIRKNNVTNCGTGMVLDGGSIVERNTVSFNKGIGILVKDTVDLGGGAQNGAGQNTMQRNPQYDLVVDTSVHSQIVIFARHNFWDHTTEASVRLLDLYDADKDARLARVDIMPLGVVGVDEPAVPATNLLACYPVPAHGVLHARVALVHPGAPEVVVSDLLGRIVSRQRVGSVDAGMQDITVDGLDGLCGVYLVEIVQGGRTVSSAMAILQ